MKCFACAVEGSWFVALEFDVERAFKLMCEDAAAHHYSADFRKVNEGNIGVRFFRDYSPHVVRVEYLPKPFRNYEASVVHPGLGPNTLSPKRA